MFESLQKRLNQLERGTGNDVVLTFEDGGTLSIAPRDAVTLFCDAARRQSAREEGQPIPDSRNAKLLNAFERATGVQSLDPLAETIWSVLRPVTAHEGAR